jgi:hypothetical protein
MSSIIILYVTAFFVTATGLLFAIRAVYAWRSARNLEAKVKWVHDLLERAVEQIHSDEEDTIIAGLQVIAGFNAPHVRARVFDRIEDLQKSEAENVAKQATWTLDAIVHQAITMKGHPLHGSGRKRPDSLGG